MTLDPKEHDKAVLTDLADWLEKLDLVDEDEREGARENITVMVETLLSRLHAAPSGQAPLEGVDRYGEAIWATRGMNSHSDWLPWRVCDEDQARRWKLDPSYRNGRRQVRKFVSALLPASAEPVATAASKANPWTMLKGRDRFIADHGLWGEFVRSLDKYGPFAQHTSAEPVAWPRDDTGRITSDYEPSAKVIEITRDAICREFGNNGTDGYYIRILKAIYAAMRAETPATPEPVANHDVIDAVYKAVKPYIRDFVNFDEVREAISIAASPPASGAVEVGWPQECATEGCSRAAAVYFQRGGVGSHHCCECYLKIQALPAAPTEGR